VSDPLGHEQSFTYDAFHRLLTETDGLTRTTTYAYDLAGRRTSRHDRNGATVTYTYDAAGRLLTKTLPGGNATTYDYDGFGRLTSADDPDSRLDFTYDASSDLTSQRSRGVGASMPDVTMSFAYSRPGVPSTITTPAGVTSYGFDDRLRLTTVDGPTAGPINLSYDAADRLTSISRPNGVVDQLTWNPAGELLSRISRLGSAPVASATYSYDDEANRLSLVDDIGTHSFTHDAVGRLLSADHPAAAATPDETYTYDLVGNRTSWQGSPASTVVYDAANRLRSDGTYNYLYDNEGNLVRKTNRTSGAGTTLDWNADHQLLAVHLPGGGGTTSYRYDPLGRRIEVQAATGTTRFAYLGPNVALEYSASNVLVASYVTGFKPGEVYTRTASGTTSYYLQDGIGSTVALTDSAGVVTSRFTYNAFGQPGAGLPGVYAFAGQQWDASTGLYYARARFYDPGTGRFISEDPVPSQNAYPYANGDPVSLVDPTGRQAFVETAIAYARGFGKGALIGGAAYLAGGAGMNLLMHRGPLDGLTFPDLLIAMASGGLSAVVGVGLSFFERVLINSVIGFVATTWSMVIGNRDDATELFFGTVFGGFGAFDAGGESANGLIRAVVASGTLSAVQGWIIQQVQGLFGPPPPEQLQPVP
jgi:RHS repeat-associated protein